MNQEHLLKSIDLIKDYNEELLTKLKSAQRILKGKSKLKSSLSTEEILDILILTSIILSGNIKVRYELDDWIKKNKAFANLTQLKTITTNCKQDCDNLKSISFSMTEVLKTIRQKEEEQKYKDQTL